MTGMPSPLPISLVIPTYEREEVLVDTIKAFLDLGDAPNEILVVDQTEKHTRKVEKFLADQHDKERIRWIRHSPPNASGARNRGLKEANGDLVLFVDDDVVPRPGIITAFRNHFTRNPEVTSVAGQIINKGAAPTDVIPGRVFSDRRFGWLEFPLNYTKPARAVTGGSGNLCVRRKTALMIGGFDERFYASGFREESDFVLRLHRAGGAIVFEPAASLLHIGSPGGGTRAEDTIEKAARKSVVACEVYFLLKNYGPVLGWYPFIRHAADFITRRVLKNRAGEESLASGNEAVRSYPEVGLRGLPGATVRVLKGVFDGIHMYMRGPMYISKERRKMASKG